MIPEFIEFPKIARLSRACCITEKIDGTNAQVYIDEKGTVLAGSRNRWLTPADDNFGFAAWVEAHREELLQLGPGRHFGEWWGKGIQRHYGLNERRWSLFNVSRWCLHGTTPAKIPTQDPRVFKEQRVLPPCVGLVPVLYNGLFTTMDVDFAIAELVGNGSFAAPGFMKPEGVVVYHSTSGALFKKTLEKDSERKGG